MEGKNLLRQRNALHRVNAISVDSHVSEPSSVSSPTTPESSPMLSRSAGRRSFKASLFSMIGSKRSTTPDAVLVPPSQYFCVVFSEFCSYVCVGNILCLIVISFVIEVGNEPWS